MSILSLFAGLGRMYAWATPERLLDMPLAQLQAYYRAGLEHERMQATILTNRIADLLVVVFGGTPAEEPVASPDRPPDAPDAAAIEQMFGGKIRRQGV